MKDMSREVIWVFPCNQWFSMYMGEGVVKRQLKAHIKEVEQIGTLLIFQANARECSTSRHCAYFFDVGGELHKTGLNGSWMFCRSDVEVEKYVLEEIRLEHGKHCHS